MITIPGTNISIPAGGIQIPTSQAISIPSSTNVQLPVASVANVSNGANVANVANGGMTGGDNKNGIVKEVKSPASPAGQGWYIIHLEAIFLQLSN